MRFEPGELVTLRPEHLDDAHPFVRSRAGLTGLVVEQFCEREITVVAWPDVTRTHDTHTLQQLGGHTMNDTMKQRAREVSHKSYYGSATLIDCDGPVKRIIDDLSAAGLLATERDVLCRSLAHAVYAHAAAYPEVYTAGCEGVRLLHSVVAAAYRALRAHDTPPLPWVVLSCSAAVDGWRAYNTQTHRAYNGTLAECEAVAAALNALEVKP